MEAQQEQRQASSTPATSPSVPAQAPGGDKKAALKGLPYDQQMQKLAPDGGANAAAPKGGPTVDDDGGPGTSVVRYENDPRYGKPKPAVKVKVADGQQVEESQVASVKADIHDPEAPRRSPCTLPIIQARTGLPSWMTVCAAMRPSRSSSGPVMVSRRFG